MNIPFHYIADAHFSSDYLRKIRHFVQIGKVFFRSIQTMTDKREKHSIMTIDNKIMCTLYKKRSDLLFLISLKLNCRTNENQRQNESHRKKNNHFEHQTSVAIPNIQSEKKGYLIVLYCNLLEFKHLFIRPFSMIAI